MTSSINSALNAISPNIPRSEWVKIAFSIKANACDFSIFHDWSKNASNYKSEADCLTAWNSDKGNGGVNGAYLFKIAQDNDWINTGDGENQSKQPFFNNPVDWFNSLPPFITHQYINDQGLSDKLNGYESAIKLGKDKHGAFIADPLFNINTGELVGFNRVYGKGGDNKWLAPKTVKSGNAGLVGSVTSDTKIIYVCEGMADALHIHNDTKNPVFIASDAGNLAAVTKAIKTKYPDHITIIIADNDTAGIKAAIEAKPEKIQLSIFQKDYTSAVLAGKKQLFTIDSSATLKDAYALIRAQIIENINSAGAFNNSDVKNWIKAGVKFNLHTDLANQQNFFKALQDKTKQTKAEIKKLIKDACQKQTIEQLKKSGTDSALTTFNSQGNMVLIEQSSAAQLLPEISPIIKNLRFDDIADCWMQYDNNNWEVSTDAKTDRCIKEAIEQQAGGIGFNIHYLKGVRDLIRTSIIQTEWNNEKNLISLKNGIFDLYTKQLLNNDKNHHITSQLPFEYNPQADCPITKQFLLDSVGGDKGQQQILRAFMNAIIKGRADMQRCLVLVGMGGTGKGSFMRLCSDLIGYKNLHTTNFKNLEGNTGRFDVGKLYRKKLLIIPDADQYTGSVETFKSITGQDSLRYEEKNKNNKHNGNFIFEGMAIIASNEPLAVNDHTSGWKRRTLNLTFDNAFNKRDGNLSEKIKAELSGVFNWVLGMSDDDVTAHIKNTAETVGSAGELAFKALIEGNPIAAWVHDNLILKADNLVQVGNKKEVMTENENGEKIRKYQFEDEQLYPNYAAWSDSEGKKSPIAKQKFSSLLEGIFKSPDMLNIPSNMVKRINPQNKRCFKGIAIRTTTDTNTPSPFDLMAINTELTTKKEKGTL